MSDELAVWWLSTDDLAGLGEPVWRDNVPEGQEPPANAQLLDDTDWPGYMRIAYDAIYFYGATGYALAVPELGVPDVRVPTGLDHPLARAARACKGIVFRMEDYEAIEGEVGFITDLELRQPALPAR